LGAVWREGLLAQAVLLGRTKGWRRHSQLLRFQVHEEPLDAIGFYLRHIHDEARTRGYRYDQLKIAAPVEYVDAIDVTNGQLLYELRILKERLKRRSPNTFQNLLKREKREACPTPHPLFTIVEGTVEPWEKSYWRRQTPSGAVL
jgi:hypothetical protein